MSTKSSISSGENYHLYDELMDGGVYLEVINAHDASINIIDGRAVVKVRLPKELLDHLKLDDQQLVEPSKMFDDDSITNMITHGKK
jgi:hypothetical protein